MSVPLPADRLYHARMTTVDTRAKMSAPLDWVDTVEHRAEQSSVDTRRVVLAILLFIPLMIGAAVGLLVRAGVFAYAAGVEGYKIGRGQPAGNRARGGS